MIDGGVGIRLFSTIGELADCLELAADACEEVICSPHDQAAAISMESEKSSAFGSTPRGEASRRADHAERIASSQIREFVAPRGQ